MANVRGILRRARRGRRDSRSAIVEGEQDLTQGLRDSQQEHFVGPDDEGSDEGSPVRHTTQPGPSHQYTPMEHYTQPGPSHQYTPMERYTQPGPSHQYTSSDQPSQPLGFVPWASQSSQDTTLAFAQGLCDAFFSSIPGGVQSTPLPSSGVFYPQPTPPPHHGYVVPQPHQVDSFQTPPPYTQLSQPSGQHQHMPSVAVSTLSDSVEWDDCMDDSTGGPSVHDMPTGVTQSRPQPGLPGRRDHSRYGRVYGAPPPCGTHPGAPHRQ